MNPKIQFITAAFQAVALLAAIPCPAAPSPANLTTHAEVVVYGGTPAGITAAIAAARRGNTVLLIDLNRHVGGMVSGGLVDTDIGDSKTVGGMADDFLKRVEKYYRDKYGPGSEQLARCHNGLKYEAHVAELVFEQMLQEQKSRITLWRGHRLASVTLDGGSITGVTTVETATGKLQRFTGDMFIDASYEGDVMAYARVPYRVGRESRQEFGEYLAGISDGPKEFIGLGDHRTQAYNYRVSITSRTENRVLFPKPESYDPEPWRATYGARVKRGVKSFAGMYVNAAAKAGPNDKLDTNWGDLVGGSEGYADGDWSTRDRIAARHRDYFLSLLYYLQNDPELPESFRADAQKWGLPKDEFADNGHFPFQLYVREGRRMLGRHVLRESDLTQNRYKPDGICAGSYGIDCHSVQNLLHEGKWLHEHTLHTAISAYDIPYACLTPREPGNLLVPVCLSSTHVAYCSLRMEPVYMMLGEAAGNAAHLALSGKTTVQKVDVAKLREVLRKEGAVLDACYQPPVKITWAPAHPKVGEPVQFQMETGDLKDPIKQVWWDFEGNGQISTIEPKTEHAFKLDKVYSVSLVVQDQGGRRRWVSAEVPVGAAVARDITMDDFEAELFGRWDGTYPDIILGAGQRIQDVFFGPGVHRDVVVKGKKINARARFTPNVIRPGRYQLCLAYRPAKAQATNVPITIRHAGGVVKRTVDQRAETTPFPFVPMGVYEFKTGNSAFLEIGNGDTNGRTTFDGIRLVWLGE